MKIVAYIRTNRKGRETLCFEGSVEHKNALMFGDSLEPLIRQFEVSPRHDCLDSVMRHGLKQAESPKVSSPNTDSESIFKG